MKEQELADLIRRIQKEMRICADGQLKAFHLTMVQWQVLSWMRQRGGAAAQKDVEKALDCSHATICGIAARLERGGFVVTETDSRDRRGKILRMTPLGEETCRRIDRMWNAQNAQWFKGLTQEQIEETMQSLRVILRNLSSRL